MEQDIQDIKRKTFFGGLWKFMERILAQLITFVVSLVLARILSPKEYGVIAVVTIMINIMNVFVTSGYGAALIQKKDSDDRDFNTIFTFSGGLAILLYAVLFFAAPHISALYNDGSLTLLIRIMGLRLPLAAFNSIQQAYVAKKMEYGKFFWATLGGTITSGVVGIAMALQGCGVWALVGQYFTNTLMGSIILYFTFSWRYKPYYSWKLAKPMIRFGSGVLLTSLVDAIYQELRAIVIGIKYNTEALAYYNRGEQFPKLIALNVATAIDGTLLPTFCVFQDDLEKMRRGLFRSVQISTLVVTPLMFGMAAVADPMIRLLITEKWLFAVPYVQIFCIMYALNPLLSASNQVIKAMGSGGLLLGIEIAKKVVFVLLLLMAIPFGPIAIAVSSVIATAIACVINAVAVKKVIAFSLREQLMSCLPQYITSLVMMALIYWLQYVVNNMYMLLAAQILSGVLVYCAMLIITKNQAFLYFYNTIKKFIGRR